VLGLVKAQMVKNTVIVPVGAKGGFYCKRLPDPAVDREAWLAEGIACYTTFITALLDVTDNLVNGEVVPPADVVRHDGDDTYLVVAADKGTATFSDIANKISLERGFWLGDAFASGGSVGYDHKAMGITARGAWVSVQRHFREMGVDCQREDFTCVGIGDMSGDVFGNGMLLSEHTRLVAAFDHRTSSSTRTPTRRVVRRSVALFDCRARAGRTTTALISGAAGSSPHRKSIRSPQLSRGLGLDEVMPMTRASCSTRSSRTGRPALERRHRHLRARRRGLRAHAGRRRQGQTTRSGGRFGACAAVRRRGRQPRPHPAGPDRVRAQRRSDQHRLHRQLRRRGHLRPRGQHQDPAQRRGAGQEVDRRGAQQAAGVDDR
jgi:hypothetical protein